MAPLMAAHAATLRLLGLHKVWASLQQLAVTGGAAAAAPGHSLQPPTQQQQGSSFPAAVAGDESGDVWALQQRLQQYKAKCRGLKATVVALEGAAARWQSQAVEVEQGLALLRFRWGRPLFPPAGAAGAAELASWLFRSCIAPPPGAPMGPEPACCLCSLPASPLAPSLRLDCCPPCHPLPSIALPQAGRFAVGGQVGSGGLQRNRCRRHGCRRVRPPQPHAPGSAHVWWPRAQACCCKAACGL